MARRFAPRPSRAVFVEVGQRIGRGVVIDPEIRTKPERSYPHGRRGARLRCDCGTIYEAPIAALRPRSSTGQPNTRSCGCLHRDTSAINGRDGSTTHGLRDHPLYGVWRQMLQRCGNPDHVGWQHYGAKNRKVCARWLDLAAFIADIEAAIGPRPAGETPAGRPAYTLDRIDNDGDYEPGNVRWATWTEQAHNR